MQKATFLILMLSSIGAWASINKAHEVEPFLDIFSAKLQRDGAIKVPVTTNNSRGDLSLRGSSKIFPQTLYQNLRQLAEPVLKMEPWSPPGDIPRKGTAFHIGHDLVLTNHHVLDPTRKNTSECEDFRVLTHQNNAVSCERVIFCSSPDDVCLIKMKTQRRNALSAGPSVKLRASYTPLGNPESVVLTAVGNSMGLGIHVTRGTGVKILSETLKFYASVTKGNSGGPLFDEEGLMIGLVKQQSDVTDHQTNPVGDQTFNIALRVGRVISLSREALKNDPETLGYFNEAVIE